MLRALELPEPIYYMGWIIQPTPNGVFVYERKDTVKGTDKAFPSIPEAMRYIESRGLRD